MMMFSFPRIALKTLMVAGVALTATTGAQAAGEAPSPPAQDWSFSGPFGTFDRAQLQRGFQVYKETCSACHSMDLMYYRNLGQPGGPEFDEEQVKAIAAGYMVMDGPNDMGDMFERPGLASDNFRAPFRNEQEARMINNGAYPPDLSVITKARKYGPDYIYGLLVGYTDPPAGFEMQPGMSYNTYFPGHQIAMAPPLGDGFISYADGSPETLSQYAQDVAAFFHWAGEPKLEERKRIGLQVMLFLIVFAALLYFSKQKLWRNVDH